MKFGIVALMAVAVIIFGKVFHINTTDLVNTAGDFIEKIGMLFIR